MTHFFRRDSVILSGFQSIIKTLRVPEWSEPCVIVQIAEGLGNQMFCYATARAIAKRNGVHLYIDNRSQYRVNKFNRVFLLDNFNIVDNYCSNLTSLFGNFGHLLWKSGLVKREKFLNFYVEHSGELNTQILDLKISSPTYLLGYWQHEEYFQDVSTLIREEFTRKSDLPELIVKIGKDISTCNSVCLHVRSYKEINNSKFPFEYYRKAISIIEESIDDPHFYIFSDDPEWAQANLNLEAPFTLVTANQHRGYSGALDDFWLMSQCKSHILWSSSFGWWAAWLANSNDSLVVAPKDSFMFNQGSFPLRWILI